MRGYYDPIRTMQSSLFIFWGWNVVLVQTLMVRSMYLVLVEDDTGVLEFDSIFIVKTILCHPQFDCLSMRDKPVFLSYCNVED